MKLTSMLMLLITFCFLSCDPAKDEQGTDSESLSELEVQIEQDEKLLNELSIKEAEIDSLSKEIESLISDIE